MSYPETVTVACTIDNNYVQHCAVMLASMFDSNPKLKFKVFIINDGINYRRQVKLTRFLEAKNQLFSFITVDKSVFRNAPISEHFSMANYFRILVTELVDSSIEKVLFLDSDIVIRRSIAPLLSIDVSQYSHVAVENPRVGTDYKSNLGISEDSSYFNSGVLLINMQMWRQLNVMQKSIDFINQYPDKIHYVDQDALNHVLQNQWLRVESQWNAQKAFFTTSTSEGLGVTSDEYRQTKQNPAVVHFTGGGSSKPWHYSCSHPFRAEYYKYLSQTPWRNSQPIGKPNVFSHFKAKARAIVKRTVNFT